MISGIKLRHLIVIILIGAVLSGVIWSVFLKEYQKQRIITFLTPQKDPQGYSYQIQQSMIAIGSGEVFGKGLKNGSQSQLKFLPERETGFIFAALAEELGLAGATVQGQVLSRVAAADAAPPPTPAPRA